MDKKERVENVLNGKEVDRPPLSLWYHFGIQHSNGAQFAKTCLDYFDYYDLDLLKVMNDYYYPHPEGIERIESKADLKRIARFDVKQSDWREQFKAIEIIGKALEGKAYFIDTVFDPWQTIKRSMAGETLKQLMTEESEALQEALEIIAENLIDYCKESLRLGAAGIFMSVPASSELVTKDEFFTFLKPYDIKIFKEIRELGMLNTAHVHGEDLYFDDVLDYPVNIFNWWDRGPNGPSLQNIKEKVDCCVMGGIDHKIVSQRSRGYLKDHVREGIILGGERRFFLANGCSIDTWTSPGNIKAIVDAARE
jgi:uroporphyrinogen decarboxylase